MLALYADVHVPAAITAGLRLRGIDVITAQEDSNDRASDADLLVPVTALGRLLFTQDDDLLRIAATWQAEGRGFSGVVYAHQMSAGIGQLIQDLELLAKCCFESELSSRVIFLPLA
jgi:hypothetical protein